MSNSTTHCPGVLTLGVSRKRKERESVHFLDAANKASKTTTMTANKEEQRADNRLLAGYLAHEFLTKGTLFGQKWDPARAEAVPVSARNVKGRAETKAAAPVMKHRSYAEVANLITSDGVHIPSIVNPTQLARWIQM